MSDLLLGANTTFNSLLQSTEPLAKLSEIMQNPASIFTGLGAGGGNPFGQMGDFSQQQLSPLEQLAMLLPASEKEIKTQETEKPEEPEKPEFPLPKEGKANKDDLLPDRFKKPDGSEMSMEEMKASSPVVSKLGNQKDIKNAINGYEKDGKHVQGYKDQFGDWDDPKLDDATRKRAYSKFIQTTEYIVHMNNPDGSKAKKTDDLEGITSHGDARNNTKAGVFKDGAEKGIKYLEGLGENRPKSSDKYVRADGSNRSNLGQIGVDIGKGISHVIPGLGNTIAGAADGLDRGLQNGNLGEGIKEGFKGGAKGAAYTAQNALKVLDPTDPKGMVDGAKNMFNGSFANGL